MISITAKPLISRQRLEFRTSTGEIKQQKGFYLFFLNILNKGKIILQKCNCATVRAYFTDTIWLSL